MNAQVSKTYSHRDPGSYKKFRFMAKCGDNKKGYEFVYKTDAVRARARLIKRLKADGFKVYL